MGNAESSSRGRGGHGEKEEENEELEQQGGESGLGTALKVAAAAAAAAAVAYGVYTVISHSNIEEEEEVVAVVEKPEAQGKGEGAGWSSASQYIPEAIRSSNEARAGAATVSPRSPPSERRFMLNTDFSGSSGVGYLIRGPMGVMLWCSAERVESCVIKDKLGNILWSSASRLDGGVSDHEGEALALLRGLEMARDLGYRSLVAETDHQPNVHCINSAKKKKRSDIIELIREAKSTWFDACDIRHVGRQGNRCANHLARVAATRGPSSFQELRDSPDLQKLLQEDRDSFFDSNFLL